MGDEGSLWPPIEHLLSFEPTPVPDAAAHAAQKVAFREKMRPAARTGFFKGPRPRSKRLGSTSTEVPNCHGASMQNPATHTLPRMSYSSDIFWLLKRSGRVSNLHPGVVSVRSVRAFDSIKKYANLELTITGKHIV